MDNLFGKKKSKLSLKIFYNKKLVVFTNFHIQINDVLINCTQIDNEIISSRDVLRILVHELNNSFNTYYENISFLFKFDSLENHPLVLLNCMMLGVGMGMGLGP